MSEQGTTTSTAQVAQVPVPQGTGEDMGAIGLGIWGKLLREDTGGAYSLFEYVCPPGAGGPPTHIHSRQDEVFICTLNKVVVALDGVEHVLSLGDVLKMPRGVPHRFWNPYEEETRVTAVVSPSGLEDYYRDLSNLPPGPRDMAKVAAIMTEHGLSLVK